jgi:hypothetical protein
MFSAEGAKGRIVGEKILVWPTTSEPQERLRLDGFFNGGRITKAAQLGKSNLSEMIRAGCDPGYLPAPSQELGLKYYCTIPGDHTNSFLDLTFYLNSISATDDIWPLFALRNYYGKKLAENRLAFSTTNLDVKKAIQKEIDSMRDIPDDATVYRSEQTFGIVASSIRDRTEYVRKAIERELGGLRVVGLQVNVAGGNLDHDD